ncbi:MAG: diaminopimelate decarboxylase, partial [Acidimicrobiales bacterium]
VYDEDHIRARLREAAAVFSGTIAYASKAFLCRAMAEIVAEEGVHLDAASMGEIYVALQGGVSPAKIVFHGNNKSTRELEYAASIGVGRIVVDSFDELERLNALTQEPIDIWLRLTPGIEAHTHEFIRTGQDDSKFGFNVGNGDADRAVQWVVNHRNLRLRGLHSHIGSQIFRLESFSEEVEVVAEFVQRYQLEELNLGGGLGVPYLEEETAPSVVDWVKAVDQAATRLGLAGETKLFLEPGRAIVATAGLTLYAVGTRKEIPGIRRYVSIDGGMSDNPRPVLYGSGYAVYAAERLFDLHDEEWSVAGKHCESGDIIVKDGLLPRDLRLGELLVTPVTGAYGYAMSSNYNKVPRPPVVFIGGGVMRVVVRGETLDDLVRLDA